MKRLAMMLTLAVAMMAAGAGSAKELKGHAAKAEIKKDLARRFGEKPSDWKVSKLGGKPGDRVRPFQANSLRTITPGPSGARIHVGFIINSGRFYPKSGRTFGGVPSQPRVAPASAQR